MLVPPGNIIVGVGVLDDPSRKSDLDELIFVDAELPLRGWDVGDAIPYIAAQNKPCREQGCIG